MTNLQEHTLHLDLFSGVGGFALAADRVWGDVDHIFVEIDPFCQKVLRKHWKESEIYGDIRTITNTNWARGGTPAGRIDTDGQTLHEGQEEQSQSRISGSSEIYGDIRTVTANAKYSGESRAEANRADSGAQPKSTTRKKLSQSKLEGVSSVWTSETRWNAIDLLTGGFPCQPFSQAGRRKGTDDNRYLWPEMFRVIREFQPTWIIAENVRGLLTWNEGLVFEQVCTDLESENYEVQPFIIPACSVNAPHRRDRVWFVAHNRSQRWTEGSDESLRSTRQESVIQNDEFSSWERDWREVAAATCNVRVDDGVSPGLDEFGGYTKARHRQERLKALGNAIVPQVAEQIMRGII